MNTQQKVPLTKKFALVPAIFSLSIFFTNQFSFAKESDDFYSSPPPRGYAKVRIWNSDLENGDSRACFFANTRRQKIPSWDKFKFMA